MSIPQPSIPPGPPVAAIPIDKSSSLWDRVSTWASENKAVVYTVAGVAVVVTGAGIVYYMNSPPVRCPVPPHPFRTYARSRVANYAPLTLRLLTRHSPKGPVSRRRSGERGRRPRGKPPRRQMKPRPSRTPSPKQRRAPRPPPSSPRRSSPPSTRPPLATSPRSSATSMRIA